MIESNVETGPLLAPSNMTPDKSWKYPDREYCLDLFREFTALNGIEAPALIVAFSASARQTFSMKLQLIHNTSKSMPTECTYDTGCEITMLSRDTVSNPDFGNHLRCHHQLITMISTVTQNDGHPVYSCIAEVFVNPGIYVRMVINAPSFSDMRLSQVQLIGWNFVQAVHPCIDHKHSHFLILGGNYTDDPHLRLVEDRMKLLKISFTDLVPYSYSSLPISATSAVEKMQEDGLSSFIMKASSSTVARLLV